MANEAPKNNRRLLLGIIVALVMLNFVLLFFNIRNQSVIKDLQGKLQKQKEFAEAESKSASLKLDSLSFELERQIEEARELGLDYAELEEVKLKLEQDKKDLEERVEKEIGYYQRKLAAYEELLVRKDQEMEKLREANKELYAQNQDLQTKANQMSADLRDTRQSVDRLQTKISKEGALRVSTISVSAVSSGGRELNSGSYRANQVDKIKVYYQFDKNALAALGMRDVYMRVVEPNGTILSVGTFKTNDGQNLNYTSRQQILFDNSGRTEVLLYDKGSEYKKGQHKVELYADGAYLGEGYFTVK
ncbi:hypothetical protein [Eisenibacter elegans]|jgi:hypothetical protein|uniref:hypothetical protein n=1 Tax=Eisenibacter elegans TaxID=997 RepID=UPI000417221A|nr:hypothetical protein [Eisenibacter elegans]